MFELLALILGLPTSQLIGARGELERELGRVLLASGTVAHLPQREGKFEPVITLQVKIDTRKLTALTK